jgi:hypothetical protein
VCRLDDSVPRSEGAQGIASSVQRALSERRARARRAGRLAPLQGPAAARGGLAIGRAALVRRTTRRGGERAGRARRARRSRDARSGCAYRVRDAARKIRSRAVAGALQAQEGKRDKARGTALAASSG